jgi:predicted enzyme related to lactoylglutathione lyase
MSHIAAKVPLSPRLKEMSMSIENALAGIAVKDLKAATPWYEKVFGRPADSRPMPEVAEWKFARGGWLQVYQLAERAGASSCTLVVTSLAQEIEKLDKLGVDTSQRTMGDKVKVLMVVDPDGNHIAFAEAVDTRMAR